MKSYQFPCRVCGVAISHKSGLCREHRQRKCSQSRCGQEIQGMEKWCEKHKKNKDDKK